MIDKKHDFVSRNNSINLRLIESAQTQSIASQTMMSKPTEGGTGMEKMIATNQTVFSQESKIPDEIVQSYEKCELSMNKREFRQKFR